MPLMYLRVVPPEKRDALLDALRKLNAEDAEVVEETDEPGTVGLRFADDMDSGRAAGRTADIIEGAQEIAGQHLDVIATAEAGWGGPHPIP